MSQQPNTCCPCEPTQSARVPLTGIILDIDTSGLPSGGGLTREEVEQMIQNAMQSQSGGEKRQWQSGWFSIAPSRSHTIEHNLGLLSPEGCAVRLVARVKTPVVGWETGDIIFGDGANYIGSTSSNEMGWVISLKENIASISFGNNVCYIQNHKLGGFGQLPKTNVECKLVIDY